jgi:hypothetical protein
MTPGDAVWSSEESKIERLNDDSYNNSTFHVCAELQDAEIKRGWSAASEAAGRGIG